MQCLSVKKSNHENKNVNDYHEKINTTPLRHLYDNNVSIRTCQQVLGLYQ